MRTNNPSMRICLDNNVMVINRPTISCFGDPSHLRFLYNETKSELYILPGAGETLDALEIPDYYWYAKKGGCAVSRMAFVRALQYRMNWEDKCRYSIKGTIAESSDMVIFELNKAVKLGETLDNGSIADV